MDPKLQIANCFTNLPSNVNKGMNTVATSQRIAALYSCIEETM